MPPLEEAFPRNSYVVLDLPAPIADAVIAIRERQRDFFRFSLPAETTVIGSSGVGPIDTSEDPGHVFHVLDQIAAASPPIRLALGPVRRFANSDVFYLSFVEETPLRSFHERLANSGLRFSDSSFPFVPHVTLRTRSPITDAEVAELLATRVSSAFTLDTLSVYQLAWREPPSDRFQTQLCLLHRTRLSGST